MTTTPHTFGPLATAAIRLDVHVVEPHICIPHCRPGLKVRGDAKWKRHVLLQSCIITVICEPRRHDRYQARVRLAGGLTSKKRWTISMDAPVEKIAAWLKSIEKFNTPK